MSHLSLRVSLARTAVFAVLYVLATWAGRLTVMDNTNLSLVWPAAGVAVVWFCAQHRSRARWLDAVVLAAITMAVNVATGAGPALAAVFVVANLAQVWVFLWLIVRLRPSLWSLADGGGLRGPRDLWAVLGAAFAATVVGAAIGPTGMWLLTDRYSWLATAVWLARNTAGVLLVGAVGLCVGRAGAVYRRRAGGCSGVWRVAAAEVAATPRWRLAEYAVITAASVVAYVLGFGVVHGAPLAFTLIAFTVWAATRLPTTFVVLHDLGVGAIAVLFTLHGDGPFALVASNSAKALVVQLFIAIVAVVGLALALGRDERVELLRELAAEKEQQAQRAELMSAIIDSMADGLSVIDHNGRVTLRNPAAVRLLGGNLRETVIEPGDYDVHTLDGAALTPGDMPHARVLAGQEVRDLEVVVRRRGTAEAQVLRVNATALPDVHGNHRAVVLYRDVTAERRHLDELANFAGVVAHDLLNPLAVVEGWTSVADEALAETPESAAVDHARNSLTRVSRAAGRMRVLINDLLAYTTARDATVAPVPVSLATVVADIAAARADAAVAEGDPVPRFAVGRLDPVLADAVLVRQLLDNLIGNAVKYTAAGVTPCVAVVGERVDDLVRVTITDNGIGIPSGHHAAIFDNFHRAHRAAGYAGTGLGLAICKRIVERHGGTITATDAPDGGARFEFTLPAATTSPTDAPLATLG
ncbi:ATP-binding protein [Actinokineospora auranticolor]|uniref:Sensor-like histidine kinase SenX3 n=1 Tax=Actinokineospora auranticolor TaxID=155976 RepID=A0A2S6GJQ2_9PSEU|nr:ATP-binding protein [Actinokineospora auranticolor]PPK65464.1 signal transduction histidine kinase [Actinokineospora auranticolor]